MESGERSAIEVLSKLIDFGRGASRDLSKGIVAISAKSITAYVQNKKNIVVGENDIKNLRNSGEPLNVTKVDSVNIDHLKKACKDFGVPISIVKDNDENFMFYRQSDSKLVQMITERILSKNLEKNQDTDIPKVPNEMDIKKEILPKEQLLLMDKKNTLEINPKDLSIVVYDKKEITIGTKDYSKLTNSKEPVSVVKIDKIYSDKFESISKEYKIPMTITKNNDNYFMLLKEKDLNKFELLASKTLDNEIKNQKAIPEKDDKSLSDVNPDNNIRNKVKEAEERLNTPSVEKTLDIVKDVPIAKSVER